MSWTDKPAEAVFELRCQLADTPAAQIQLALNERMPFWMKFGGEPSLSYNVDPCRRIFMLSDVYNFMKAEDSEVLTPEDAATFWHGLELLEVPPARWTKRYYRDRMEHLFEVMRGRPNEGVTFDAKPLSEKQAAAVINLFSTFLDDHDLRLDCPNGHDNLKSGYDGGYTWCEKCGAVDEYDLEHQAAYCRKRGCPIKKEYGGDD